MTSLRQLVFDFLEKKPSASYETLYEAFEGHKHSSIDTYRSQWRKKKEKKILSKKKDIYPEKDFIDDPNELLMNCAKRELNRSTPDVRWAGILLNLLDKTKQLDLKDKNDVMIRQKLVPYSSKGLIKLRKKLIES